MGAAGAFRSFFMGGFECSSHRRADGLRLDLIHSTAHFDLASGDYRNCALHGLRTVRDGLRWHLIESAAGVYDWSSWIPMVEAAAEAGVEVIWDLFHYGSPDHLDQGGSTLTSAFARFAAEAVRVHRQVTGSAPWLTPINEISFFTWAVRNGYFPPAGPDEHGWFKRHLIRTAIAAIKAIREVDPDCRLTWAEPLIHIIPRPRWPEDAAAAEQARLGQFEAYDMLLGLAEPELGGSRDFADVLGFNFYPDNQWYHGGSTIPLGHYDYRPLSDLLVEAHERFGKPIFLSETGAEHSARSAWFHYVCGEVREAINRGVPIEGICLYPVTAYPGWDDLRHAEVGLFTGPQSDGRRRVHQPLADELARQRELFGTWRPG
jgi:beta-glucosidase/6-phospho-beta-glucosidase/beta-galactosidase